jgi:hypothetical protein
MATMYLPPNNVKQNDAAKKMYGEELRRAINTRLSSDIPNEEVFNSLLQQVWDRCVASHDFRIWFTPSLVAKQTSKVNGEYVGRQKKTNATWERLSKRTRGDDRPFGSKMDPASQGWTIEKCDQHIAEMKQLMKDKKINRYIGQKLMSIPIKAKERLLNARD